MNYEPKTKVKEATGKVLLQVDAAVNSKAHTIMEACARTPERDTIRATAAAMSATTARSMLAVGRIVMNKFSNLQHACWNISPRRSWGLAHTQMH